MQKLIFLTLIALICLGCKEGEAPFSTKDVGGVIDQLEQHSQFSVEELQKLQQIEYKVETVPSTIAASALAARLSSLGEDRWDCFEILPRSHDSSASELIITCKRPVKTPLRWLPRTIVNH